MYHFQMVHALFPTSCKKFFLLIPTKIDITAPFSLQKKKIEFAKDKNHPCFA